MTELERSKEIIQFIANAEKTTPVELYTDEEIKETHSCKVIGKDGLKIVFGDWQNVEKVIKDNAPASQYRNRFLADAMLNLNMIDTIGSGIRKMFDIQYKKFFPLPDYDFSDMKVRVTIIGKVLDINYARQLAQFKDISLLEIMMLDKIQKGKNLTKDEVKLLRDK